MFYILEYGDDQAIVIDPPEAKICQDFLDEHNLKLDKIFITHEHHDHYQWVEWLNCSEVYAWKITTEAMEISVSHIFDEEDVIFKYEDYKIQTVFAPWHAAGHMMFEVYNGEVIEFVLVGDVLFPGGVGNTYWWDSSILYDSIQKFQKYHDAVMIYSGHDYLETNLEFIKKYFPERSEYCNAISAKKTKFTNMWEERNINPFLLCDREAFIKFRELRNTW